MGTPKYALLSYDREAEFEGGEGHEETGALCEDAEDLFADQSPPLRQVHELVGCAPEGELREALTRARAEGSAPLGFRTEEILDRNGTSVGQWQLEDVRVLGDRPCAHDLRLRDITIEASQPDHDLYDPHGADGCPRAIACWAPTANRTAPAATWPAYTRARTSPWDPHCACWAALPGAL